MIKWDNICKVLAHEYLKIGNHNDAAAGLNNIII